MAPSTDLIETEIQGSLEEVIENVEVALRSAMPGLPFEPELVATFPDRIVYSVTDPSGATTTYSRSYATAADGTITFGDPVQVSIVSTVAPAESAPRRTEELGTDLIPLDEAAVAPDGTTAIKIIAPGWSTNGRYYSPALLRRDIPVAFPAGTHMHLNHQTVAEEAERPEGDLHTLAGVLATDPAWSEGPAGPGMYARARIFAPFREMLGELAPHIGTSIRAWGSASQGEAEGQHGAIVERIETGRSVDFVTRPGAGGRVLELVEAARSNRQPVTTPPSPPSPDQEIDMTADEIHQLIVEAVRPLQSQIATLRDANVNLRRDNDRLRDASSMALARSRAEQMLAASPLPNRARARVIESVMTNLSVGEDGTLDQAKFEGALAAAEKAEIGYLREAGGRPLVHDMGSLAMGGSAVSDDDLAGIFRRLGLSESAASKAAAGRSV